LQLRLKVYPKEYKSLKTIVPLKWLQMKTKTFSLMLLGTFFLLVLTSLTSALSISGDSSFDWETGKATITINGESGTTYNLTSFGDFEVSFNPKTGISDGDSIVFSLTSQSSINDYKIRKITLNVTDENDVTKTSSLELTLTKPYCDNVCNGNISAALKIENNEGLGEDKEWYVLDKIEFELTIDNNNNDEKLEDLKVKWMLYDSSTGNLIIDGDEDDLDWETKLGDIKKGEDDEEFTFYLDLADFADELEDGSYTFYFKVLADEDGTNVCDEISTENIDITIEDDLVVLDEDSLEYSLDEITPGSTVTLTGKIWNIGEEDQDDIYIEVYNKELGIDERFDLDSIDSLDSENFEVTFEIPENAAAKSYTKGLMISIYDEDNDLYEADNDDEDESVYYFPLIVSGEATSNPTQTSNVVISANLQGEAKAGEDIIVKATITNAGTSLASYALSVSNYGSWASSATLNQNSVVLNKGQSQEITITLKANEDVSGSNSFNIDVISANDLVLSQPVSVSIQGSSSFSLNDLFGNNTYLWIIGGVNLLLVIVIIFVAIRVLRR